MLKKIRPYRALLFFFICFSSTAGAQVDSNKVFEASKGKWEYPIEKVMKIITDEDRARYATYVNTKSTEFLSDSSYEK